MNADQLGTLLWQAESETLDFKRDQYEFDSANKLLRVDARAELLKDILAFANAWRSSPAHILIGVQEVKGGRGLIVGAEQILNRALQTFVNSKVNRPLSFFYEPMEFEGKSLAVITVPVQDRPFFLRESFGKLEAEKVYLRRGDTTDIADPDEIAQMGAKREFAHAHPALEFAFADLEKRSKLPKTPVFRATCLDVPEDDDIPAFVANDGLCFNISDDNEEYYSDLGEYLHGNTHLHALGVVVSNVSRVVAQQVVVHLLFKQPDVDVKALGDRIPDPSKRRFGRVRPDLFVRSGIDVTPMDGGVEVMIALGDIQPGTQAWSKQEFYLGRRSTGNAEITISISGNNIAEPILTSGNLLFEVESKKLSVDELVELGDDLSF